MLEEIKRIKSLLEEGVTLNDFPGASFAIIKNGQIAVSNVGYKEKVPNLIKNSGDEIYDIASLTKVVLTTTVILKLIEAKKLELDTKISALLKRFMHPEVTIFHLLTHSSGLPADIKGANKLKTREEVLDIVYASELLDKPLTKHIYSDIGFIILGLVIEEITGLTLDQVGELYIFKDLLMKDTSFYPDPKRVAPTELREDQVYNGLLRGLVHDEKAFALGGLAGHAGLFSTVSDLALFIKSILDNKFVLGAQTIDTIFETKVVLMAQEKITKRTLGYDLPTTDGIFRGLSDLDNIIWHTGFTGCHLIIDRKRKFGFVLLSNSVHPKRELSKIALYRRKINEILYNKED